MSRLEVGSSIGLPLFLAQALGIAFYISGFSEAVVEMVDVAPLMEWIPLDVSPIRAVSLATLAGLTLSGLAKVDKVAPAFC